MSISPLRIGIIGCGNISNAYLTGLRKFDVVDIVSVADLVAERAEAKASEHGIRASTIEGLLDDKSIDLVINLTVPKVHAAVNRAILEAKKHVYVEKPFALDLTEGQEILDLAAASGLRVGCAPDTFLGGGCQTARKLLDEGAIGEPVGAVANMANRGPEGWHPDPEFFYQVGGGPMLDIGPYYVTALVKLLGPIRRGTGSSRATFSERVIGSGAKKGNRIQVEIPTHYAGVFDFVSGPVAALNISFDVWSHQLPIMEIYGTEGTIRVPNPNTFGGIVEVRRSDEKEWRSIPLTHSDQVSRGIGVVDMAIAIQRQRPHRVSGALAYHVLEAMLSVQLASESSTHVLLKSTVERPSALPVDLPLFGLDA